MLNQSKNNSRLERTFSIGKRAACLMLFVFSVGALFGQDSNPRLTFESGGSFLKAKRTFIAGGDPFRSEYANGGKATLRGAMDMNRHWSVETSYGYGTNNLRIYELNNLGVSQQRDYGVRIHQFSGNVLAFMNGPDSRVRLFGTAGLGLQHFSPTGAAKTYAATVQFVQEKATLTSNNALGINFGAGIEAKATDQLGLRFDFRDHITGIPHFGVPQVNPGTGADYYPVNGHVQNLELSVGVLYYLAPHPGNHR